MHRRVRLGLGPLLAAASLCATAAPPSSDGRAELLGRAVLPALRFAPGPTAGQLLRSANGVAVPFVGRQPVQGFSALVPGPRAGTYLAMTDNGFGSKANSPDALLRVYALEPDFASGTVHPVDFVDGERLAAFDERSFIGLRDPRRQLPFAAVADRAEVPGTAIPVDAEVVRERLLTGADLDIESMRRAPDGSFWFGDEFGPFLLHADARGALLAPPIPLPNPRRFGPAPWVRAPDNPLRPPDEPANLGPSKGLEGLAIDRRGRRLYTLLEGPLAEDPVRTRLLLHGFDLWRQRFTGERFAYRLESPAHAIGDFTAVDDRRFLVIERDELQGDDAAFKKIYKVDLQRTDREGFLRKELVADLLDIADPRGLGSASSRADRFRFPFVTIESLVVLGPDRLLVANDNNLPFSSGRTPGMPDDNEFILLRVARPLAAPLRAQKRIVAVPGAPRRSVRSMPSTMTAFMPKLTAPPTRSLAR